IMVEDLIDAGDGKLTILSGVHPWQNVRQVGEDICMGDMIAPSGTVLTPASNEVTFIDTKSGNATQDIQTVLTADEAATYTMEYTLGEWAATAKADATQAVCDLNNIDPAGAYLIEDANGQCFVVTGVVVQDTMDQGAMENLTVRKANARGGFGAPAGEEDPKEGLENTAAKNGNIQKIFRDGQVVIVRDGKEYNILGAEL
ncbi:MAG: hypothetical protein II644_01090, partial [Paludibacteraceae bacterium]|nr:hypothetical protein [Paludibacteraceae bacterium]